MISTNQFKNGMTILIDGKIFEIIDFQHVKPGKGGAFVRSKLKNFDTGAVIDRTFRAGEKFELAIMEKKTMQYLYNDGSEYYFMDNETYEQVPLSADFIGDDSKYLKEGTNVDVLVHNDKPLKVKPPISVELEVTKAEPGMKGDTATGGTKPVTLETGLEVQVPLFINEGDILKIDTRTGSYVERV
jgi:elongation factor P